MIKRRFYLTLVAALILLITSLLWGCGDEKSTKSVSGSKETKPITMRIAHSYPETTQHHRNMLFYKKKVEEYTNGRVQVSIFPNAQLCSIDKEMSMVLAGSVESAYTIQGMLETIDPAEAIWSVPFLFKVSPGEGKHLRLAMQSDKIEGVLKKRQMEKGIYRLGNIPTLFGFFIIGNNKLPVTKPDDMKGLKIRHPGGMMGATYLSSFSASPVTIAGTEVPVALSQGVVDGLTTTIVHYHDARWHTKYVTLPFWNAYTLPFYANLQWWNGLPSDIKDIIEKKVMPEVQDYAFTEVTKLEKEYIKSIQEPPYNVKVTALSDEQVKEWAAKAREVGIETFVKKLGEEGRKMVEEVNRLGEQIK